MPLLSKILGKIVLHYRTGHVELPVTIRPYDLVRALDWTRNIELSERRDIVTFKRSSTDDIYYENKVGNIKMLSFEPRISNFVFRIEKLKSG